MSSEKPTSEQLRGFIIASGQSQLELAQATGIPQPTISKFLTGKRGLRLADFDTMCRHLGLKLSKSRPKK